VTNNCLRRTIAVAAFLLLARTVSGQDSAVHLDVQPVLRLPSRTGLADEVFGPVGTLTVEIHLDNADPVRTLVLEPGFFAAITWRYIALGREAEAQALAIHVHPAEQIPQFMEQSRAKAKNLMSRRQ